MQMTLSLSLSLSFGPFPVSNLLDLLLCSIYGHNAAKMAEASELPLKVEKVVVIQGIDALQTLN